VGINPFLKTILCKKFSSYVTVKICDRQKEQSVNAVQGNNGPLVKEKYGILKSTVRAKYRFVTLKPGDTFSNHFALSY
jgi:hypothetical protein